MQDPEGGCIVTVPSLDEIATPGETLEEAREMAADLIQGYIETLEKAGRGEVALAAARKSMQDSLPCRFDRN